MSVLSSLIDEFRGDWSQINPAFQSQRKQNTDAVNDLAKRRFYQLSHEKFDEDFQRRSEIVNYLSDNYEEYFMSQHQMIEHSDIEFYKILTFGKVEDEIVKQV